jgi:hypothetical protein
VKPRQAARQVLGGRAGRVGARQRGERGEAAGVAGPGHLSREVLGRFWEQQPWQAGPDDIATDQREHPAAQGDEVGPGPGADPAGVTEPAGGQSPPGQASGRYTSTCMIGKMSWNCSAMGGMPVIATICSTEILVAVEHR